MKFVVMIKALPGSEGAGFGAWLLDAGAALPAQTASRAVLSLVAVPGAGAARFDAVLELWAPSAAPLAALLTPAWTQRARSVAYAVDESIEMDRLAAPAGHPTPAVKLIAPWSRHAHVSPTEARRHWDEHVPLARRVHVGCERYVRHWVQGIAAAHALDVPAYQGIAFQYYRTQQDLEQRAFDAPESVQLINDDVADFLADCDVLVTTERLIKDEPHG